MVCSWIWLKDFSMERLERQWTATEEDQKHVEDPKVKYNKGLTGRRKIRTHTDTHTHRHTQTHTHIHTHTHTNTHTLLVHTHKHTHTHTDTLFFGHGEIL